MPANSRWDLIRGLKGYIMGLDQLANESNAGGIASLCSYMLL